MSRIRLPVREHGDARMRRIGVGARLGLLCSGFALSVLAQPVEVVSEPIAPSLHRARNLFAEAAELEARQEWAQASEKLREVLAIRETAGVRFHLAFCLENHGALVAALQSYRRAALLNEEEPAEDVAALLAPALERIALRVPLMTVDIGVSDVGLLIDGESRQPNTPLELDPGPHLVEVTAPGFIPTRRRVTLSEAERRAFVVELDPLPPRRGLEPDPIVADPPPAWPRPMLVASGAFTLVAAGASAALTVARTRAARQVADGRAVLDDAGATSSDCVVPGTLDVERACWQIDVFGDDRDRARAWQAVGFAATGVGVAAFASSYLLWRGPGKPREDDETVARNPRIQVAGHPGQSGKIVVSGRF